MRRETKKKIAAIFLLLLAFVIVFLIIKPMVISRKSGFVTYSKDVDLKTFDQVSTIAYDKNGQKIQVVADKVVENDENKYVMQKATSSIDLNNGDICYISADNVCNKDENLVALNGNVTLHTKSGIFMQTPSCIVNTVDKISRGTSHINMVKNDIALSGDGYLINLANKFIIIDNNSHILSKDGELFSNKLQATLAQGNKLKTADALGNVKCKTAQYYLTANKMHYDTHNIVAQGNVKILYIHGQLYSDKVTAIHKKNILDTIEAVGNAKYISEQYVIKSDKLIYKNDAILQAINHVHLTYMTKNETYNIFANAMYATIYQGKIVAISAKNNLFIKTSNDTIRANYGTMKDQKIYLSENVVISGEHGDIFGETAELDMNTGKVMITKSSGIINEGNLANTK